MMISEEVTLGGLATLPSFGREQKSLTRNRLWALECALVPRVHETQERVLRAGPDSPLALNNANTKQGRALGDVTALRDRRGPECTQFKSQFA